MPQSVKGSFAATCVDYDSDDDAELTGTKKQANVALKRTSQSSGLGKNSNNSSSREKLPPPRTGTPLTEKILEKRDSPKKQASSQSRPLRPHDLASDSGYSTRTQATTSSADSSATSRSYTENIHEVAAGERGASSTKANPKAGAAELGAAEATQNRRRAVTTSAAASAVHEQDKAESSRSDRTVLPVKPSSSSTTSSKDGEKVRISRTSSHRSNQTRTKKRCQEPNCEKCVQARELRKAASPTNVDSKSPSQSPPLPRPSGNSREASSRRAPPIHDTRAGKQHQPPPPVRRRSSTSTHARPRSVYDMDPRSMGTMMMPPPPAPHVASQPPMAYYHHGAHHHMPPPSPHGYQPPARIVHSHRPEMAHRAATDGTAYSARRARPSSLVGQHGYSFDSSGAPQLSARRVADPRTHYGEEYYDEVEEEEEEEDGEDDEVGYYAEAVHNHYGYGNDEEYENEEDDNDEDEDDDEDNVNDDDESEEETTEDLKRRIAELQVREEYQRRLLAGKQHELSVRQQQAAEAARQAEATRQMPPPPVPHGKLSMRGHQRDPSTVQPGYHHPAQHHELDAMAAYHQAQAQMAAAHGFNPRRPSFPSSGNARGISYSHHGIPTTSPRIDFEPYVRNRRSSFIGSDYSDDLGHQRSDVQAYVDAKAQEIYEREMRKQSKRASVDLTQPSFAQMIERTVMEKLAGLKINDGSQAYDDMVRKAVDHQRRTEGTRREPLTAKALRRRQTEASEAGSARSASTRASQRPRTEAATSGADGLKMRIDLSNGFEAEIDGRRFMLNPTRDGNFADLVIEDGRDEGHHKSTKGSTTTTTQSRTGGSKLGRHDQRHRDREVVVEEAEERENARVRRSSSRRAAAGTRSRRRATHHEAALPEDPDLDSQGGEEGEEENDDEIDDYPRASATRKAQRQPPPDDYPVARRESTSSRQRIRRAADVLGDYPHGRRGGQ